jgi:D-xylose transport system substrate-binding protein
MKLKAIVRITLIFMLGWNVVSGQGPKIGFVLDSYESDRWYMDQRYFQEKVTELGGQCVVEVAYGNPVEQVNLCKKLIQQGVKVLVVISVDAVKSADIATLAKASNVPLISYDRLILSPDITVYLSYNNVRVGELQAEYVLKLAPAGKYVLINGPVADNNAVQFRNGQLNAMKASLANGKVKVIGDFVQSDWSEIGAMMRIEEFLGSSSEKPDVIIAGNDGLANGAIEALPANLTGKVFITGQDADVAAIRNIVEGKQSMTIYKPIKPLAYKAAELAMNLAKGKNLEGYSKFQSEKFSVNAILLDPAVVDKNNYLETVVKDGHVSQSEIKR